MSLDTMSYQGAMNDIAAGYHVTRKGWVFSKGYLKQLGDDTVCLCVDGVQVRWRPMQTDIEAVDWIHVNR